MINNVNGSFKDIPVEIFESKYPLQVTRYGILADTGGAGTWRGGNGTYREYRVEADSDLFLWFERSVTTAWGLFGGESGSAPVVVVERPDQPTLELLKVNGVKVPKGTLIRSRTGGGGGYGPPQDRDPQDVLEDVIDGYVTVDHARSTYRVEINDALEVDLEATERLRSA